MPDKVTIVHLRDSNFVGGPERQILEHFKRMESDAYEMILVCYEEPGRPNDLRLRAEEQGLSCLTLPVMSPFSPKNITRIIRVLREAGADMLVTHGHKGNIFGRLACWRLGIPTIAVSRGWTMESLKIRFFEFLDKVFLHFADHVVAVSDGQRRKILACGVRADKVSVIHNCIDVGNWCGLGTNNVRARLDIPADAILVSTAGRLSPEKNQRMLLQAAERIVPEMDNVYFAVFGEGVLRGELEAECRKAGLEGRFLLPGFWSDMVEVMQATDIFTLPSLTEGLPNVVLEAFACSTPVVATSVGGTPELVRDGESGFLVEVGDVEGLAVRLLSLGRDEALRERMGSAGRDMVSRDFTYPRQAELYRELYGSLVKNGGMR
ncbi:glycosyltransferase family 4 protein [Pseudodesulfovibrio karagichevae]|uniref:Glycosyltransferase family 4 protein n=1 Tax=Pseudodesulfovibrio karagichevae TaxID=3239305 RepID=A0ABV4K176_9BACT